MAGKLGRASGLAGHAVRALVQAPSDANILIAGALDGVFRSNDLGKTWERITPLGDSELRNFDSLAIDPQDPAIIYAGTFHLPWKTIDGGKIWMPIHRGMIDDSDVLSLEVNLSNPQQIFASACSGIYRSEDAGANWNKIEGDSVFRAPHSDHSVRILRIQRYCSPVQPKGFGKRPMAERDGSACLQKIGLSTRLLIVAGRSQLLQT